MKSEILIPIVNGEDHITGYMEKLEVHRKGLLHRAFSILVFNDKGDLLIHKRADGKYHSSGLWTNTCCGHPGPGESMEAAVSRRLNEEMGFICPLAFGYKFHYRADFENGLTENEIDHVYLGRYNGDFSVNPEEVSDYRWISLEAARQAAEEDPEHFTVWFRHILAHEELEAVL